MANYYVSSGSSRSDGILNNGDRLYVYNGGSVSDYDILQGGNMYVSAGGSAENIILHKGGNAVVNSNGTAQNVVINYGGVLTVSSGGSADIVFNPWSGTINSAAGAIVTYQDAAGVYYGATDVGLVSSALGSNAMTGLNIENGRSAFVINGGQLNSARTTSHGTVIIADGGLASTLTINSQGEASISSGGLATDVTVYSGGALTIYQAGSASATHIARGGALFVQNNGHLTGSTIISAGGYFNGFTFGGRVDIYSDDNNITLSAGAKATVLNTIADLWNKQSAIGAVVSRGGFLQVHSGGVASNTSVKEIGQLDVFTGGIVSGTLLAGSRMVIRTEPNSGTLVDIIESLGRNDPDPDERGYFKYAVTVVSSGTHEFLYHNSIYVYKSPESGGELTSTWLDANVMNVSRGGSALNTHISSGGVLNVNGGYASQTQLQGDKWIIWNDYYTFSSSVDSETSMTSVTSKFASSAMLDKGIDSTYVHVMNGGLVVATEVGSYGGLYISSAGTADYTYINDSGSAYVLNGGLASHTNIYSRGNLLVSSGGVADRTFVKSGGNMRVSQGGTGSNTMVNSMGNAYIFSGGLADESLILLAGSMHVYRGGVISNTFVNSGGKLYVSAGGSAHIAYMPSTWMGDIISEGGANITYAETPAAGVYYGGDAYGLLYKHDSVDASQKVIDPTSEENKQISFDFTSGQSALVFSGGSFTSGTIGSTGALYVYEGGLVTQVTANTGAIINGFTLEGNNATYAEGLQISNAVVSSGMSASLFGSAYTAEQIWINGSGSVFVESGSVLSNTDMAAYASLQVASGGTLRGFLNVTTGATVTMQEGSVLEFSLANRIVEDGILVNDLSLITGTPTYTISVSTVQAFGTYEIANGSLLEDGRELVFTVINGAEDEEGNPVDHTASLTLNGTDRIKAFYYKDVFYKLTQTAGKLFIQVTDKVLLDLYIDVTADIENTTFTATDVILTADFADFAKVMKYSFDGGQTWTDMTDGGTVTVERNGTVTFYAEDKDGTSYTTEYIVENIDKDAPVITAAADVTDPTNGNVTITASADDGSGSGLASFQYRIDGSEWTNYVESIVMEENGKVEFRAADVLGNETADDAYVTIDVTNIDKIPPAVPEVSADITEITSSPVTVTAVFSGDSVITEYSTDGGQTWNNYTAPITVDTNTDFIFRAADAVGNYSQTEFSVDNIDQTAPEITVTISPDPAVICNFYTITVDMQDDTGLAEQYYQLNDGEWISYTGASLEIVLDTTGEYTYKFKAIDKAGRETYSDSYTVTVDATPVEITYEYDTSYTNKDLLVNVSFTDSETGVKAQYYRFDEGEWISCGNSIVIEKNGTLQFKALDNAGNETVTQVIVIENIDKSAPVITIGDYDQQWTNQNMVITADITDAGVSGLAGSFYRVGDNVEMLTNAEWLVYDSAAGVVMEKNGLLQFKAIDKAGNEALSDYINISNIDKVPPAAPEITASETTYTQNPVILTADYPADSFLNEYSMDGVTWMTYPTKGIVVNENNTTVYFRATDKAGNHSEVVSKTIDYIFRPMKVNVYSGTVLVNAADVMNGITVGGTAVGRTMEVSSGGIASATQLEAQGQAFVYAGGAALKTTIGNAGGLHVYAGANVTGTTVNGGGYLGIGSGACADNTVIQNGGAVTVWNGGLVSSSVLKTKGALILSSGAIARQTTIASAGALHIYAGGVASGTTVSAGGYFGVGYDAKVYNTIIDTQGSLTIWGGGIAYYNTINTQGNLILSSGAAAKTTHVSSGGGLHVYSGAKASNTTVDMGGYLGVGGGATTIATTINNGGSVTVWSGGLADKNQVNSTGNLILSNGGIANSTTIQSQGGLHIYNGAIAYTTEVTSGAQLGVGYGGTLHNSIVDYTANVIFYDGSLLNGWNEISGSIAVNGSVNAENGMIAFVVSNRSTADGVLINDITGLKGASFFVTVDSDMASGKYLLAGNAQDFDGSVTITGTAEKLTVGGRAVTVDGSSYTLRVDGKKNLYLNVAKSSSRSGVEALQEAMPCGGLDSWEGEGISGFASLDLEPSLLLVPGEETLACGVSLDLAGNVGQEKDPFLAIG